MKEKLLVKELKLGMYVVGLDRPWSEMPFESPFELQGFTVRSAEEIAKVKKYCSYVYVDRELEERPGEKKKVIRSAMSPVATPINSGPAMLGSTDVSGAAANVRVDKTPLVFHAKLEEPVYHDQQTVEEELRSAREILSDTKEVYEKVINDIRSGRKIDASAVKNNVDTLVESVIRNPDAATWLVRLKRRDDYTYSHSMEVCVLALAVGRFLGLPTSDLRSLGAGALLQDVGKIHLPRELLSKTGDLNERERVMIETHVDASLGMLKGSGGFALEVLEIVHLHHERYDGNGYPRKLKGNEINMLGTIAGMADVYSAVTNHRPYRNAITSFEALMYLYENRQKLFSTAMVENLIQSVGIFPVGSFVLLNTGQIGVVVARHRVHQLKPRVMVLLDSEGHRIDRAHTVDLSLQTADPENESAWCITKVVDPKQFGLDRTQFFG
ncbi:MAG: HD-GYP domain-containing protein [Gammaproteobacteria bacterium]|nr:HD-GYP domain-containing protein [Gammaproteobacteria bacterium]MDH3467660.1 HD-GYP domain-containing protein [Gammaproteobacteria bacterium]